MRKKVLEERLKKSNFVKELKEKDILKITNIINAIGNNQIDINLINSSISDIFCI